MHAVPPAAEYSPALQAVQTVSGDKSKSAVPAAQSVHETDVEYWPVEHDTQAVAALLSVSAWPVAQSTHAAVPTAVFSVPGPHAVHVELAFSTVPWNPGSHKHEVTAATPVAPSVPELMTHDAHVVVAPSEYVSVPHAKHAVEASLS